MNTAVKDATAFRPIRRIVLCYHGNGNTIPGYPPRIWSTFQRDGPKTQNYVESFHARINAAIEAKHIGVFKLLSELKRESKEQLEEIEHVRAGYGRKGTKNKCMERNERIKNIVEARDI